MALENDLTEHISQFSSCNMPVKKFIVRKMPFEQAAEYKLSEVEILDWIENSCDAYPFARITYGVASFDFTVARDAYGKHQLYIFNPTMFWVYEICLESIRELKPRPTTQTDQEDYLTIGLPGLAAITKKTISPRPILPLPWQVNCIEYHELKRLFFIYMDYCKRSKATRIEPPPIYVGFGN